MDEGHETLRLASAGNFRDLAGPGYTTGDGAAVRPGVAYRSNELVLNADDATSVAALGVTHVLDLREGHEVEAHPDTAIGAARWQHVPVAGIPMEQVPMLASAEEALEAMHHVYRRFVTDSASRASFAAVLRAVAESDDAVLFHCSAGKDRTGWSAWLLLTAVGVPAETALGDYLLTNDLGARTREKYVALIAEHLGDDKVAVYEPVMVARESYLTAAREAAESAYGSIEGYLRDGLGLDDAWRGRLRARLL